MKLWKLAFPILLLFALSSTTWAQNDVVVYDTYMSKYLPTGEHPVTFYFYNNDGGTLDNFTVQWRLNNGEIQEEFVDLDAMGTPLVESPILHSYTTEQTFEIDASGGDEQLLEIWVVNPEGSTDLNPSDNYDSHSISRLENHCQRKVLLETHRSIDDSYGPDVELTIAAYKEAYPNLLVASWHTDGALETPQNWDMMTTYDIGHTYALIDRHLFPPVYEGQTNKPVVKYENWQDYMPLRFERYSPVHMATENSYNPVTKELTVDITATFLSDLSGDFRFNCFLIEDPVIGPSDDGGYAQINRYSHEGPASGGPDHPYYNYPSLIYEFPHRNVALDRLGGTWGTTGVIPSTVAKNTVITHQYTYTVPEGVDIDELSLITMVQKHDASSDYRDILNALDCPLNGSNEHEWITETPPDNSAPFFTLGGRVLLEGAYSGSGMMHNGLNNYVPTNQPYNVAPYNYNGGEVLQTDQSNVIDWVLVEARTGVPNTAGIYKGTSTVETRVGVILADGSFADPTGQPGIKFYNLDENEEYYFCVRHRNHLDMFTAYPTYGAINMYYDFTSSVSMALGNQQQKLNYDYKAMMLSGDYNQDGIIQVSDADVWRSLPAAADVYNVADGNLDGSIQVSDFDSWFYNKAKIGCVEIGF